MRVGLALGVAALGLGPALSPAADPEDEIGVGFGRKYPPRIYRTVALRGTPPEIDGRLDDAAWREEGEWAGEYRQQIPTEGAPPSYPTQIKILYDAESVYVAIRAYDDLELVHRYPGRRDDFTGDIVGICFDSYFDKRGGFEFDLTAGGSKLDLILGNDGWDTSWDAVWHGKTALEDDAWTAEFRIPLSQLRYDSGDEQVWGMHAWRWINRLQEEDQWNLIPRNNSGILHNIGELHGIRGLERYRHVELLPHTVGRGLSLPDRPGDPYSGGKADGTAGLDAKLGLTTDFTLDATIHPDFGQVEADPSEVNLTAFETFFAEKRPFFLEGKDILAFEPGDDSQLFYSRRIGQAPSRDLDLRDDEYARVPDNTSILSAVKVTGKTRDGLSLGVVQSLTLEEQAKVFYQGQERRERVEPWSNYFVARLRKDWDQGNTSLGGMLTSTHRWLGDAALEFLPRDALSAGVDFSHYFGNRAWRLDAMLLASNVRGSTRALTNLQANAVHYYQRPDASHLGVDADATSLWGHGGRIQLARPGTSKWRFASSLRWFSPGLELNDLGFLRQADRIDGLLRVGYQESEPGGVLREWGVSLEREDAWDFGGLHTKSWTGLFGNAQFVNRWRVEGSLLRDQAPLDTRLLRGGPAMRLSSYTHLALAGRSDDARRLRVSLSVHGHRYSDGGSRVLDVTPGLRLRLSNRLSLRAELAFSDRIDDLQYVASAEPESGPRYILGRIDQKTRTATFRIDLHLTPDLSIQYYGSPFVSAGRYTAFKRAAATQAARYEERFTRFGDDEIAYRPGDDAYEVSEADGVRYAFDDPDFSFRQFRSNLVARWEFTPGSTLYLVWSQARTSSSDAYEPSYGSNFDALWRTPGDDVFLIKLSYWFSL